MAAPASPGDPAPPDRHPAAPWRPPADPSRPTTAVTLLRTGAAVIAAYLLIGLFGTWVRAIEPRMLCSTTDRSYDTDWSYAIVPALFGVIAVTGAIGMRRTKTPVPTFWCFVGVVVGVPLLVATVLTLA